MDRMESEKKIPTIRFSQFSNDWKKTTLDDETIRIGDGLHGTPVYSSNGGVHFINGNNLDLGCIKITEETKQVAETLFEKTDKSLTDNTILISINGTIGNLAIYRGEKIMLGKSVAYLKLRSLDKMFTYTLLQSPEVSSQFSRNLTGSTIKNLGLKTIRETVIRFPSPPEQKKIGSFFQNIDQLITLHQKKYDKLVILKKAMLVKMFPREGEVVPEIRFKGFEGDWVMKKINKIADRLNNLRIPIKANKRVAGNTPYYGANGIQDYVQGFTHDGEFVLVAEDGANDLKDYPIRYVKGKLWVNNHAHVLAAKKNITENRFLNYAIKSINIEPFLVGGGRAKLNSEVMMQMNVIISNNIKEQQKIGNYFHQIEEQISLHQTQLDKLTIIKKACLSKMFVAQD